MKVAARILTLSALVCASLFLSNCGPKDPDPETAEETQLNKLKGTWTLSGVEFQGGARTDYSNIVLVIEGTYVAEGSTYTYHLTSETFADPSAWPKKTSSDKGEWKFGASPATQLVRDPTGEAMPMTYTMSGDNQLTITFTCTTCAFAGGNIRTKEVNGLWEFSFTK